MAIIKSENWDGVTAPAIPAGWTVDTQLQTATTWAASAPNALAYPAASIDGSVLPHATWATPDTNGGDVQVSGTIRLDATSAEQNIWLLARADTILSAANVGAHSNYMAVVRRVAGGDGLSLQKRVAGTATTLAFVSVGLADATNYRLFLRCLGSTISGQCQRLSDSFWLNSSGTFVSDPTGATTFASVTDSTLTTAGYAGLATYLVGGASAVYLDDWLLETASTRTGATFYVSPSGNDANDGTSTGTAWQTIGHVNAQTLVPGDQILFQGGQTFSGNLVVHQSGAASAPIMLGSYGSGDATISCGNGTGILLQDCDYVEVSNLVIAGSGVTASGATSSTTSTGYGVEVKTTTTQTAVATFRTGVSIDSVTVSGCHYGICGRATAGSSSGPNYPVGHNGLQITNCTVHDCSIVGIMTSSGPETFVSGCDFSAPGPAAYFKNARIADCTVYNVFGDSTFSTNWSGTGIVLCNTAHGLIERCVVYNCGQANGHAGAGPGGIWLFETLSCVIQYCEVHHMHDPFGTDGVAYDFDGGTQDNTIQYCYSHDNDGPSIETIWFSGCHDTIGNVFRYNVCVNDGQMTFSVSQPSNCVRDSGNNGPTIFHNNVLYCDTTSPTSNIANLVYATNSNFYNNIFYCGHGIVPLSTITTGNYVGNLYYFSSDPFSIQYNGVTYTSLSAFRAVQETLAGAPTGLNANPLFQSPGSRPALLPSLGVNTLQAYTLASASPAIGAAVNLRAAFDLDPGLLDFRLAPIPYGTAYDIGACEYGAAANSAGGGGGLRRVGLNGGLSG